MKKIFLLVQFLLVFLLSQTALAMPSVVDEAQLLNDQQEQRLVEQLEGLETSYGLRAAVVTLPTLGQMDIGSYADSLVNEEMVQGEQGTLVLVQVIDTRQWYISTDARLRDTLGSAKAIEEFSQSIVPFLRSGDYAGAYEVFADEAGSLMYYYQEEVSWWEKLGVNEPALVFALFLAFIITKMVRRSLIRSMDNVQEAAAADDYLQEGSFQLLESSDDFLYSNTVSRPRRSGRNRDDGDSDGGNGGGGGSY